MRIIDKLADEILESNYFLDIFKKCSLLAADYVFKKENSDNFLTDKELNDALRFADILSNDDDSKARNSAYQIITSLNNQYSQDETYRTVAKAVYSKLGNFPAINYLRNYNKNTAELPIFRDIEVETKKLIQKVPHSDNLIFTDSQYQLYKKMSGSQEFSFSGPTSMGKSFIIKAFIKKAMQNSPPENLVIIVPTRALINQFTQDIKSELRELSEEYKYKVLTNSNINDFISEEPHNYILVLTPERLLSYLSQDENPPIGFIFVDEAHKLANEKDSRSVTTYTAIEKTLRKYGNVKLYFSSPNVSNPEIFLKLFDRNNEGATFTTNESPVSQNLFLVDLIEKKIEFIQKDQILEISHNTFFDDVNTVTDLVKTIGSERNNLIYCNSKTKTIEAANQFIKDTSNLDVSQEIEKSINKIKEYIHPDYYLVNLLKKRVAFHYGKLPQLIRNMVEDLYNSEEVKNVFCTSTLLEGVNMPTQNIFIINNRNGGGRFLPIDFWNLSGRAGRLTKELSGNIFCVKHIGCEWEDKEIFLKKEIELNPTVLTKIDHNIIKIEKVLNDKSVTGTQVEQEILKYIANIISVDTLELMTNYKSPLIERLIENNKDKIIELAKNKVKDYTIPLSVLSSNQSIDLSVQNNVFIELTREDKNKIEIALPSSSSINYDTCLFTLNKFYDLYQWENAEKKLRNKNRIRYFAMLMNQWVNGITLKQIISQSIDYYEKEEKGVCIDYGKIVPFEKGNIQHINIIIEGIIDDIEYLLRFLFEKYFNHYYQVVLSIKGEDSAGENWASLLEYGTQNRIAIALQNIGLSRHTALVILKYCKDALTIKDGKLERVDKNKLLAGFKVDSIEYDEIRRII